MWSGPNGKRQILKIKKTTQIYPNGKNLEWFIVAFTTSN